MSQKIKKQEPLKIRPFHYLKDWYWVDSIPYRVVDGKIQPMAGLPNQKREEELNNYLLKQKNQ